MRIACAFRGREWVFETDREEVVIGRPKTGLTTDLDLSVDKAVSRPHARLWAEGEDAWIEDLHSRNGTFVNNEPITGRRKLGPGDVVRIGETSLVLEREKLDAAVVLDARAVRSGPGVQIRETRGAESPAFTPDAGAAETARRLAILYALPLQLATETRLETLLQTIIERAVAAIPGAARGALLVKDSAGKLLLKAHVPPGEPAVSSTLAQRAIESMEAFSWQLGPDPTLSQTELAIRSGMYAPLVWKGEVLGVICVGDGAGPGVFDNDALQFLVAVAHHAAMALVQRHMQDELHRNAVLLGRLLTNFSPQVRTRLLERASRQRLHLGGERSEVTILSSDIRGFTRVSAGMDVGDVVDLLNDYFSLLVTAIFANGGTVAKFMGDAILAVFGSPEPDPDQHEKAVRAAVAMQAAMREANVEREAGHQVTCDIGIGLHCGEVLHGFIGSEDRMEFTVIGDAVNLATRYCDVAPAGAILMSPEMHEWVWKIVHAEPTTIKTKHEGDLRGFRVNGLREIAPPARRD
jgi:adenylate cyclase